jgi:diacylglycerol kinase family enzyme
MKVIGLLNAKAGTTASEAEALTPSALRDAFAGVGIDAMFHALAPEKMDPALREALAARPDAIVVGGGDGTVRSAAALLAGTGIPLGVLPLGTLNHFAKDLKMPLDWRDAVSALADATAVEVDIGEVNGHVFINNCSIGAYAEAVRRRDSLRRDRAHRKWPAMIRASFESFRRLRLLRLRLTVAGEPRAVRTPLVVVANNRYSGHVLNKSMRARLDEGRLWIYTAHVHRHLSVLRLLLQALVHRLDNADGLAAEPATEALIESEAVSLPVAADGELIDVASPLRFRIRPRALRVLMPRKLS